ncbi:solute carrier family 23 protein [Pseudonocardia acidicola]|uniref:Uncharacterized protein n=1 Tax=Pseudonocardia acidicola TaxID=2724939 RepID=A0ABX1SN34_9PSEU|nr:solute carrier family 23 protein [Pseudonocardia acidicola]NMI01675.1 hypothetical protein [Pseudonocardia acidicola]
MRGPRPPWLVGQLARQPGNPRLAALVGLLVFWLASWPFGVAANDHAPWLGLDSLGARTVEHVLRLIATYCLLVFITSTIGARREVARSARRQLIPLAVVIAAMLADATAIPAGLREDVADLANGTAGQPAPVGVAGVALFFLIENLYYGYAFAVAARWSATAGACRSTPPWVVACSRSRSVRSHSPRPPRPSPPPR